MSNTVTISNSADEITAVWLTKALREGGVPASLNEETAVSPLSAFPFTTNLQTNPLTDFQTTHLLVGAILE